MKNRGIFSYIFLTGFVLCLAGILLAQTSPDRALFVNGKASGTVTQVGGRSYIDLDTVAQITNGTFTVEPTRILLNIPAREANASAAASPVSAMSLSKDFARSAIAALAEMREWRGAIGTILTYGVLVKVLAAGLPRPRRSKPQPGGGRRINGRRSRRPGTDAKSI